MFALLDVISQAPSETSTILNYKRFVTKLSKGKTPEKAKVIKKRGHIFSFSFSFSVQTLTGFEGAVRFSLRCYCFCDCLLIC